MVGILKRHDAVDGEEVDDVQQQAAAAKECHVALRAKASPRVDVADTPKASRTSRRQVGLIFLCLALVL